MHLPYLAGSAAEMTTSLSLLPPGRSTRCRRRGPASESTAGGGALLLAEGLARLPPDAVNQQQTNLLDLIVVSFKFVNYK